MNCERVVELLTGAVDESSAAERRVASEHAEVCADCRGAVMSVHALRLASLSPVPAPRPNAFERAVARAVGRRRESVLRPGRFWLGLGVGAALAASVAVAIVTFAPFAESVDPAATPQLQIALNEPRDVSISLTTEDALTDAEIRVRLSGSVDLSGYAGRRELQWRADLDAGTNQLTLPIVATGVAGGQVLVEVVHGGKRRTFLVDVLARA